MSFYSKTVLYIVNTATPFSATNFSTTIKNWINKLTKMRDMHLQRPILQYVLVIKQILHE